MPSQQIYKIWVLVAIGSVIALLGLGIRSTFGIFLAPMSADLGWGREVFALAIGVQNLIWGFSQPFAGMLADKFGTARVIAVGAFLYGFGVYGMATASSPFMLQISGGLLVGMGLSGVSFALVLAALGRIVPENYRTLSFGIVTAATSMGQFLLVPLGHKFMEIYGWSAALIILAVLITIIAPLSPAFRGRNKAIAEGTKQSMRAALKEARQHAGFLYLTAGFFVCGFHIMFITTHLPGYVTENGLSAEIGAWSLAIIGLFNIFGAITAGILGNRFKKKNMLSLLYLSRAVAIALFVLLPLNSITLMVFSATIGLSWLSTVPLTSGIVAQVFGPQYMATLFGFVMLSHQFGAFLGVWLGGYLFDLTGSYEIGWWVGVALALLATIIHLPIDERPVARLSAPA